MTSVGIVGASGYAGAELLRLIAQHPHLDLVWAAGDTQAGSRVAELYPSLIGAYPDLVFATFDPADADGLDVVFLALPHGKSQELVPDIRKRAGIVIDVAADFRLKDASLYPTWYGEAHLCPELLAESVYGLPELHREALRKAKLVAVPGCYPTAATLALAPLIRHGAILPTGVIVDAACGVSGAGRTLKHGNLYGTVAENYEAYGLLNHRHTPEMEQNIGAHNTSALPVDDSDSKRIQARKIQRWGIGNAAGCQGNTAPLRTAGGDGGNGRRATIGISSADEDLGGAD